LSPFVSLVDETNKEEFIGELYQSLYFYPVLSAEAFLAALPAFNEATKRIALKEKCIYADIALGMERSKKFFLDNYHLTSRGAEVIAANYANAISEYIKERFPHARKDVTHAG
jgi:hypothetical protein